MVLKIVQRHTILLKNTKHLPPVFPIFFLNFSSVFAYAPAVESDEANVQVWLTFSDDNEYSLAWSQFLFDSNTRVISEKGFAYSAF